MRVNLLTPGFTSPNGCAFLFPLLVWRRQLEAAGIQIFLFHSEEARGLTRADVLMVDSKFHRNRWAKESGQTLDRFAAWGKSVPVAFFDTGDSSGGVLTDLVPLVKAYCKSQLLRDRAGYAKRQYGRRIYTDYYHRTIGVKDDYPEKSTPIQDPAQLSKLKVSWNSGLADYSRYGPFRMTAYRRFPVGALLGFSPPSAKPAADRPNMVSCRFGTSYSRHTVAWQRLQIKKLLADKVPTDKLSRGAYLHELRNSKVIVSPFGLGEITLKDFEVFLTGGLLLKPDMSHLETWPDFFQSGKTMVSHTWGLADLPAVLQHSLENYDALLHIAETGQRTYRSHTSDVGAAELFVDHLRSLLETMLK
jgi:hypothetical protein